MKRTLHIIAEVGLPVIMFLMAGLFICGIISSVLEPVKHAFVWYPIQVGIGSLLIGLLLLWLAFCVPKVCNLTKAAAVGYTYLSLVALVRTLTPMDYNLYLWLSGGGILVIATVFFIRKWIG